MVTRTRAVTAAQTPREAANKTRFKGLDRMTRDPRIVEIWDEGDEGIWAQLAPGYNFDGSSCLHEWTVRDLLQAWQSQISVGPPY